MKKIFKGTNSPFIVMMFKPNGIPYTVADMANITRAFIKVTIDDMAYYADSNSHPSVFDWATYASSSFLLVDIGMMDFPVGRDNNPVVMVLDTIATESRVVLNEPIIINDDALIEGVELMSYLNVYAGGHWGAPTEVTLVSGVATITEAGYYSIDSEADAATDDMVQITGLDEGDQVILGPASDARSIVAKNGIYMKLGADFTLNNLYDRITLLCIGSDTMVELARSDGGA